MNYTDEQKGIMTEVFTRLYMASHAHLQDAVKFMAYCTIKNFATTEDEAMAVFQSVRLIGQVLADTEDHTKNELNEPFILRKEGHA